METTKKYKRPEDRTHLEVRDARPEDRAHLEIRDARPEDRTHLEIRDARPEDRTHLEIRDARPEDAAFLAKCILAGMHLYDFETDIPGHGDNGKLTGIYERLTECEKRSDMLYTYANTRIAEMDGKPVGALLSYPGEIYRDLRHKTFTELWPDLAAIDRDSDQETDSGEYYLDSLAVLPSHRGKGIGRALLKDGIEKGVAMGYRQVALVADAGMPHLISLYKSLGFEPSDHRRAFGVDFLRMIFKAL